MRIATYLRISTDEERQPFSLEAQAGRLGADVAAQPGWRLVLLLLVFKVDRLARSVSGLAQVLEALDAAGVAFRSASEPFDTSTPAGRMMVQMPGGLAEFERELILERTKVGLAKKAAKAEWTGGTPPSATATTGPAAGWCRCRRRRRWCSGPSPSTSTGG